MAKGPLGVPGAKPAIALSVGMMMFGVVGATNALAPLTADSRPAPPPFEGISPELEASVLAALDAAQTSPSLLALSVANLLMCGLLVVASLSISSRRRSALWWTRQALVSNLLFTLVAGGVRAQLVSEHGYPLALYQLVTNPSFMEALPPNTTPEDYAQTMMWVTVPVVLGLHVLLACVYGVGLWLTRRATVRAFLERSTEAEA